PAVRKHGSARDLPHGARGHERNHRAGPSARRGGGGLRGRRHDGHVERAGRPAGTCRVGLPGGPGHSGDRAQAAGGVEYPAEEAPPEWQERCATYEAALGQYEASQWAECCRALYPLLQLQEGHYDIPSLNLIARALECLKTPPKTFDSVFELSTK